LLNDYLPFPIFVSLGKPDLALQTLKIVFRAGLTAITERNNEMIKSTLIGVSIFSLLYASTGLAEGHKGKHHFRHGPPPIEDIDKDGDKAVSYDEFLNWHSEKLEHRFKKMDANQDGKITKEEFEEARSKLKDFRKKRRMERKGEREHERADE
jgi:hypothetical protein